MYQILNGKNNIALVDLAQTHLNKLNYKSRGRKYKKYSQANLLSQRIDGLRPRLEKNKKDFFEGWKDKDYEFLKRILLTKPEDFPALIVEVENQLTANSLTLEDVKEDFEDIFRYGDWRGTKKCKWLFEEINVIICPYCNSEEVYTTEDKMFVEFDHYYPQSAYPYLTLSFYNLIPSCHHCNATCKGPKPFCVKTHLHPYVDNYHNIARFDTNVAIMKFDDTFEIVITPLIASEIARLGKYNEDFELVTRYNRAAIKERVVGLKKRKSDYPYEKIDEFIASPLLDTINSTEDFIHEFYRITMEDSDILNTQYSKIDRDFLFN
jgi:hypothetical protein